MIVRFKCDCWFFPTLPPPHAARESPPAGEICGKVSTYQSCRWPTKVGRDGRRTRRTEGKKWRDHVLHRHIIPAANLIILKRNSSFRSVARFAGDWRALDCLFLIRIRLFPACAAGPSSASPWQSRSGKCYPVPCYVYLICLCSASIFSMIAFLVL